MMNKPELYLAVRKNEYIEIHSTRFHGDLIFQWCEPYELRLTVELKKEVLEHFKSAKSSCKGAMSGLLATQHQEMIDKVQSIPTI